jgi:hypothetical protein
MKSRVLPTFEQLVKEANAFGGKKHLLLGNGFSIGAHPLFKYGTLFEQAKKVGVSEHVLVLFDTINSEIPGTPYLITPYILSLLPSGPVSQ